MVLRQVEVLVRAEALVVEVPEHVPVELVAAGLGDHVDHAAGIAAVLRLVAARLDLDFLDELPVEGLALEPLDDVGRVDAVDQEQILRRGRTVNRDRERAALGLANVRLHAGLREHDRRVVATERQLLHHLGRVAGAGRGRSRVHERRLTGHGDGFLGRDLHLHVDGGRRVEGDRRVLGRGTHSRQVRCHPVDARRNADEAVASVVAGGRDARALKVGTGDLNRHAGQRPAVLIGHRALDRPGRLG